MNLLTLTEYCHPQNTHDGAFTSPHLLSIIMALSVLFGIARLVQPGGPTGPRVVLVSPIS
jgi:hypothetical protein